MFTASVPFAAFDYLRVPYQVSPDAAEGGRQAPTGLGWMRVGDGAPLLWPVAGGPLLPSPTPSQFSLGALHIPALAPGARPARVLRLDLGRVRGDRGAARALARPVARGVLVGPRPHPRRRDRRGLPAHRGPARPRARARVSLQLELRSG